MSDEELVKRLRKLADDMEKLAAPDWDEHYSLGSRHVPQDERQNDEYD